MVIQERPGHVICDNVTGIQTLVDAEIGGSLYVEAGTLRMESRLLTIGGDVFVDQGGALVAEKIQLVGDQHQYLSLNGTTLHDLMINKTSSSAVTLESPLRITGLVRIESPVLAGVKWFSDTDVGG